MASFATLEYFFIASKALFSLVGLVLNVALVYVTIRAKWLHNVCNVLIAFYALGLSAYNISYILGFVLTNLKMQLSAIICFCAYGPLLGLFSASFVFMLAVATDRLLGVLTPIRYKMMRKSVYFLCIICVAIFYSVYYLQFALRNALVQQSNRSFKCAGIYATLPAQTQFSSLTGVLEVFTMLLYVAMGMVLKKKSDHGTNGERVFTYRIYKSLLAVMLVGIFGLFLNTGAYFALQLLGQTNMNPNTSIPLAVTSYFGLLSCCADAIIFYQFSYEYRRAFTSYIPWIGGNPAVQSSVQQVFGVGAVQQVHPLNHNNNAAARRTSRTGLLPNNSSQNIIKSVDVNKSGAQNVRRSI